ncbi:MAG: hypothetical protein AAF757_14395 [Cyanobacteria bacterium P01_D01_bin.116]
MFLASQMTAEYKPTTVISNLLYLDIAKTGLQTAKSIQYINSYESIPESQTASILLIDANVKGR